MRTLNINEITQISAGVTATEALISVKLCSLLGFIVVGQAEPAGRLAAAGAGAVLGLAFVGLDVLAETYDAYYPAVNTQN